MQLDVSAAGRLATVPQKLKALAWAGQIRLTWAGVASITVLAAYLLLLPLVARTWRTTGDEPHYLLAAHSLVVDGDFDLTNNYANLDYLNFYISQDITPSQSPS